jgi:Fe(3+) dicitrate transport protein
MKVLNTNNGSFRLTIQSKVFNLAILLLFVFNHCLAQNTITVINQQSVPIANVLVRNNCNLTTYTTNINGQFNFENLDSNCVFTFSKNGYNWYEISCKNLKISTTITLKSINELDEVLVSNQANKNSGIRKLKDFEETAIYAGKKTEVVIMDNILANKANNTSRQIFAQVVGLTIGESSDGGLQLNIGSRGLDPNRTSNFNTRQNDYDISADVLGYPESYYATPAEAIEEIQVVRGAASLQYGTQFGGLINFKIKKPTEKAFEATSRNTIGSYGLYTNFTSLSGTNNKFSYYVFSNYKHGDGYRPNSEFESNNVFTNFNYQFSDKTSLHFDYTYYYYLAQQAGGLTDAMFNQNPRQSNRTRNWFAVNWNLYALRLKHQFNSDTQYSLQLFALDASRKALGFRDNRIATPDPMLERDLIIGEYKNWGAETRLLKRYDLWQLKSTFLVGAKYYQSENAALQGPGSSGSDADFRLATTEFPNYESQSNYQFPNFNLAFFGENIFKINSRLSITPGFRFEYIKTEADGYYQRIQKNLVGTVIFDETIEEQVLKKRNLMLFGVGLSYKPLTNKELYANFSQNYRSVTFSDIRTISPSFEIDPNITDEKGFGSDIGLRGNWNQMLKYDTNIFGLYYNDKISEYQTVNTQNQIIRYRSNLGTAFTYGIEALAELDLNKIFLNQKTDFVFNYFTNLSITKSRYLKSDVPDVEGKEVEFVPLLNLKTGINLGYKSFLSNIQLTYLSAQYTDATNSSLSLNSINSGIIGEIPSYYVVDFSFAYKFNHFKIESGCNNLTNHSYFTRRATGYPGPGIIPSDGRTVYATVEFKF